MKLITMYNEQLEQLINYAIQDGELSETERRVIINKAAKFDIDADEICMVLDARLQERRMELGYSASPSAAATSAVPTVEVVDANRCSACGAPRVNGNRFCQDCGNKFPSPVEELKMLIAQAKQRAKVETEQKRNAAKSNISKATGFWGKASAILSNASAWVNELENDYVGEVVHNFPIPENKEDLVELIDYCHTSDAWGTGNKERQLITLALSKYSDDKALVQRLNEYKKNERYEY